MASTIILSDNGASSGSAGLKQTAGNDGVLILQTTTSGGTATTAVTADNLQNVGFGGVTPNVWQSTRKAIQVGDTSALAYGGNQTTVGNNFFINSSGTNSYIKASTYAHIYIQGSDGSHEWYTAPNTGTAGGSASFTRLLAVNTGYSLALQGANSQTGTGITFPAVQNASSNVKTLDDYEEGTWTPALSGATFSGTTAGTYVKVGQVITVWGYASLSWSSSTSSFYINNLPFTVYNDSNVRGGAGTVMCQSGVTFNNYVTLEPINNAVTAYFESNTSGTNRTDMGSSNFASGGFAIRFTITYRTSA